MVVALLHAHLHLVRGALGGGLEVLGLQLLLQELVVRALWGTTDGRGSVDHVREGSASPSRG